jgi:nitroreductase
MAFKELLEKRQSYRVFLSTPVDKEKIEYIIHSALKAPTAKNEQGA